MTYPNAQQQPGNARVARREMPVWIAVALLLVAIAASLGPVVRGGFSYWDDEDTISLNPDLHPPTWAGLAQRWTWPHLHIYVPLVHTAWNALAVVSPRPAAAEVGNFAAWPFKLTNLGVHAGTSVLVLLILRRLIGRSWIALVAALAFTIHPIQVETIAWASGLKDLLFALFSAGCVLAYLDAQPGRTSPRGTSVVLALVLLILAGLSKPTAMVVPAMLLTIDLVWLRRPAAASVARLMPFIVVGIVFAAIAWRIQPAVAQNVLPGFPRSLLVAIDALAFYATKLVAPLHLAYDYGRTAPVALADMQAEPIVFAIKMLCVAGAIVTAINMRRRLPLITLGLLWTAIPLAPVLGLTYFDFSHYSTVADHYAYLPMMGVAVLIGALLERTRHDRVAAVIAGCVVLGWMALTFRQSQTWLDARAVTLQTLRVNERSYASWSNLALSELRGGQLDAALMHARKAVDLATDDPQSMFVLANVLQETGDDAAAVEWIRKALTLSPYSAPFHHRLAVILGKRGDLQAALSELDQTLAIDPRFPSAAQEREQLRAFSRVQAATRRSK